MEKKQKKVLITISILLVISLIIGIASFAIVKSKENEVKIYDNVYIINSEDENKMPIQVNKNNLVFNSNQNYKKDDVIVAGILQTAPNGFIRKVIDTKVVDNQYVVETTYACLTDVFEEAHVTKAFSITGEAVTPVDTTETNTNARIGVIPRTNSYTNTLAIGTLIPNDDSETDLISLEIEKNLTKNISVIGSIGYRPYLLIDFDIENHEIDFSMAVKNVTKGNLSVELGSEKSFNESISVLGVDLPTIEFTIETVPVVITNSLDVSLDGLGGINGSMGTNIELSNENTTGFEYSSLTGKVNEIKENTYLGNGIDWNTKANASADIEAGANLHIASKLYDMAGIDLAAGIFGSANAEINASPNKKFNNLNYAGRINLAVTPKLKGDIVVTEPVIDEALFQQPLFEKDLKPLWEKNWSSSGNWKQDILKANPVTIDKNSKLYEMYLAILKYVKEEHETRDSIGFQMFYYMDENNIYPRGAGLGMADFNGATPVYYLRDLNYDDIPELFIGKKSGKNYEILAVYSYVITGDIGHPCGYYITSVGDYWDMPEKDTINFVYLTSNNEILIRHNSNSGGELITYSNGNNNDRTAFSDDDNATIMNTNDLDWKELSEFSSDLKKSNKTANSDINDTYKKELAYSQDGLEVYVSHKMGDVPIINITGTNNTDNDYYCYITGILYDDKYSTMSPLYDINKSEPNFSIATESSFRTDESLNQKGYSFTIVVNNKNTNEEVFRKTFTGK